MKKKLKIFSLVFVIVLLVAASYLLYVIKFKEYDVADEEVEKIVKVPYEIELPDGSKLTLDEEQKGTDSEEADSKTAGSTVDTAGKLDTTSDRITADSGMEEGKSDAAKKQDSVSKGTGSDGTRGKADSSKSRGNNETEKKPTVASIKQKYAPTFENLQVQADNKLNSLIGHAKKEYIDKKESGESISYGYFYNKYVDAANGLEAQTDAAFNSVIKAVEKDLVANGYGKSYAQSFIDEYNVKKKERRDSLISKAMDL
ncbi:hypothetical protein ACFPRA_09490 [Sporosarcina soli]|uniref:Uncharacterized protein n=1 Tax=Sporosarcina soli TaxID=334736 RepID=A0ABW0TI82_9BACL